MYEINITTLYNLGSSTSKKRYDADFTKLYNNGWHIEHTIHNERSDSTVLIWVRGDADHDQPVSDQVLAMQLKDIQQQLAEIKEQTKPRRRQFELEDE